MRNWNTFLGGMKNLGFCFQTTYEELKQPWFIASPHLYSFQTTYEELKHQSIETDPKTQSELPDYLWGIETDILEKESQNLEDASRLPMRNWNHQIHILYHLNLRFQTTYEELKLGISPSLPPELRPGFQTTYEELKQSSIAEYQKCKQIASRLPMRNWNKLCVSVFHTPSYSGFQTTYEELKLAEKGEELEDLERGFQTTYEELKLAGLMVGLVDNVASRLPMRNWNHRWTSTMTSKRKASRLPMRNWNWTRSRKSYFQCVASRLPMRNWNVVYQGRWLTRWSLPDYLWGIETSITYDVMSVGAPLPDYLWGIETSRQVGGWSSCPLLPDYLWGIETWADLSGKVRCSCFQTTYEELKLRFSLCSGVSASRFQTTYEELKHWLIDNVRANGEASRLPMRNWNRWDDWLGGFAAGASRLPMRNWNHVYTEKNAIWRILASRLPMRNWNTIGRVRRKFTRRGFQTTYEELKHNPRRDLPLDLPLPDYLWGIETGWPWRWQESIFASRLPMRNWNWTRSRKSYFQCVASRLPMRNWNVVYQGRW